MIKSPCKIRAIRLSLKLEIAMLARTILLLSMLNFNFCQGAKYYPSLPNHGIYRCNFPCFKSCVIIRGQPNMRTFHYLIVTLKFRKLSGHTPVHLFGTGLTTFVSISVFIYILNIFLYNVEWKSPERRSTARSN